MPGLGSEHLNVRLLAVLEPFGPSESQSFSEAQRGCFTAAAEVLRTGDQILQRLIRRFGMTKHSMTRH